MDGEFQWMVLSIMENYGETHDFPFIHWFLFFFTNDKLPSNFPWNSLLNGCFIPISSTGTRDAWLVPGAELSEDRGPGNEDRIFGDAVEQQTNITLEETDGKKV